jgi:hypothetical protein
MEEEDPIICQICNEEICKEWEKLTKLTLEYADYKEVPSKKGYKVAYTVKYQAGPQAFDMKLTTIEINKGISDEEFK